MGALTIAFDITIVGALALPWVLIVMQLFFFRGENRLEEFLDWVTTKKQQAAAGVLLFALTYTLGSAVSRTAKDFFNDDDLRAQVGGEMLRVGVTEDRIVARVYCEVRDSKLLLTETDNPAIVEKIATFQTQATPEGCERALRWTEWRRHEETDEYLIGTARDLFSLQENGLLLKGEDATLRLRQLHDQIMVLRGAGFNGLVGFSLCVFALGAKLRREKPRSWLSLVFLPVPAIYFVVALIATVNHFGERAPSDPPYMEFTIFLLALVGGLLVWRPSAGNGADQAQADQAQTDQAQTDQAQTEESGEGKKEKKFVWRIEHWSSLVMLSAILSIAAILAWWSTEVMYVEQVIYSYDSQLHQFQGAAAPYK